MSEINDLAYFLNSLKETLPFSDEKDFQKKIRESKEFRIRVQKLVYLSKFFGWENSYHFNFHERGPYSIELNNDYQKFNESIPISNSLNLKIESFKNFIKNQNNDFLEATSTIIYYLSKTCLEDIDENKILTVLSYLKPHLPKKVIINAYEKINEYNLLCKISLKNHQNTINKEIVIDKIDGLIRIFENFEICSNQLLILGSLDYIKLSLKKENLKKQEKSTFLNRIYDYVEFIEKFYFNHYNLSENFPYSDLSTIDKKFDELQYYVSDLGILPRLYDENVDLNIFCE